MASVLSSLSPLTALTAGTWTAAGTATAAALLFNLICNLAPLAGATTTTSPSWTVPDGLQPALSTTWNNGDTVNLSWQALNSSIGDLWLSDPDPSSDYAVRLASNINLGQSYTLPWSINIGDEQLAISDIYALYFVPTGQAYNKSSSNQPQIASPTFYVYPQGSSSSGSGTAAAVVAPTSTPTTTPSSDNDGDSGDANASTTTTTASIATVSLGSNGTSNMPSPKSGGPAIAIKAGTAVAAVVAVSLIVGLLFWVFRLRRRVKQAESMDDERKGILPSDASDPPEHDSELTPSPSTTQVMALPPLAHLQQSSNTKRSTLPGLHELKADTRQPQEMSVETTRGSIYEMPA